MSFTVAFDFYPCVLNDEDHNCCSSKKHSTYILSLFYSPHSSAFTYSLWEEKGEMQSWAVSQPLSFDK